LGFTNRKTWYNGGYKLNRGKGGGEMYSGARIWYCPNEGCKGYRKNVKEYVEDEEKLSISVGKCPICKTRLKTMKGKVEK